MQVVEVGAKAMGVTPDEAAGARTADMFSSSFNLMTSVNVVAGNLS